MKFSYKRLDEIGSVSRGRSKHRPRNAPELYGGPYPFVQTADVKKAGLYLTEYSQTYSEKGLAQSKLWPKGTLCITIAANIADTAILGVDACFPDSVIGFISDDSKSNVKYVKYLFDCTLQTEFKKFSQGAAQDNLSQEKLLSIKFPVPDIECQNRIVAILSDYDSAIDNARRQIALLEEAAMRLYREWFGDGKGKKMPLGEFVEITTSGSWGTDAKTAKTPNEVVCIRGADFEEIHGRSLGKQIRRFISDKHLAERGLKDGDLVVEMSGGSPTQSTGRVVSISDMLLARYGVPVLATNFCKVVRPKSGYSHFLYLAWRDLYVSRIMFNYEVGTTGIKNFDYDLFVSDVEVTNPLPKLTQFNGLVDGMFSSIDMLGSLVQDLTEARDRLLPKLMSGEIEV